MKTSKKLNMRLPQLMQLAVCSMIILGLCTSAGAQQPIEAPKPTPLHEQLQKLHFPAATPVTAKHDPGRLYAEAIKLIAEQHIALIGNVDPASSTSKSKKDAFLDKWKNPPYALETLADADRAIEEALKSLGERFDGYTVPKEVEKENREIDNESVGIGIAVRLEKAEELVKDLPEDATGDDVNKALVVSDDHPIIATPFKGGPADKAGMQEDDIIWEVDGKASNGRTYQEVVETIRGKKGTVVEITVKRMVNDTPTFEKLKITRDAYQVPVVHLKNLKDDVWHLKLDTFNARGCAKQVHEALEEMLKKGGKSLILDLRDNGGGLLNEAIDICAYMLPEGNILAQQSRLNGAIKPTEIRHHVTIDVMLQTFPQQNGLLPMTSKRTLVVPPDMPIVVLINEWSASASELTSGTLRFNNRATIVGVRTLGKGVGQSLIDLPYGRRLRLTTFNFLPANQDINWIGVAPHVEVKNDPETRADEQLDAARSIALEAQTKASAERQARLEEIERLREKKREEWKLEEERRAKAKEAREKAEREKKEKAEKEKADKENQDGNKPEPELEPADSSKGSN